MKFEPIRDADNKFQPPTQGIHKFEIMDVKEKVSKRGEPMLELYLKLDEPNTAWVIDCLPSSHVVKLKLFLKSIGQEQFLERGEIAPNDLIGKKGMLEIVVYNGTRFGSPVRVVDYLTTLECLVVDYLMHQDE